MKSTNTSENSVWGTQKVYIILSVLLAIVPFAVYVKSGFGSSSEFLESIGVRTLWPINMNHQMAYSDVRHVHTINRALHAITNPIIYVTQTCLMDLTPEIVTMPILKKHFKGNFAGLYFLIFSTYWIAIDTFVGFVGCIWLFAFHKVGTGHYKRFIQKRFPKSWVRATFFLYLFNQGIQIMFGHLVLEKYYDWNLVHLFFVQQFITVYGVLKTLKLIPHVMEAIDAMTPFYADCIKNNIDYVKCEALATVKFPQY
jgi:hypothetical protein